MSKAAAQQPQWVCRECGERHKAGMWQAYSTWHGGRCDVCQQPKIVTEPRDCGYLLKTWMEHTHA